MDDAAADHEVSVRDDPDDAHTEAAVDELTDILGQLDSKPDDVPLLRQQIRLLQQLHMVDEALDTIRKMASLVMLSEDLWLSYFASLIPTSSSQSLSLEAFVDIIENMDLAENDYISIPILLRHVEFITHCARAAQNPTDESGPQIGEDLSNFLTVGSTRDLLRGVLNRGQGVLGSSQLLWQPCLAWELDILQRAAGSERQEQVLQTHQVFLDRLSVPHSNLESTSSAYSSFCSQYCPEEYESRMVQAIVVIQQAKDKYSLEKRYGRTREDFEQDLAFSTDSVSQCQILLRYLDWELGSPRARQQASLSSDIMLVRTVFERTVEAYAQAASAAESVVEASSNTIRSIVPKKGKGKTKAHEDNGLTTMLEHQRVAEEMYRAYKEAEAGIWLRYAAWTDGESGKLHDVEAVLQRATRACPQIGAVWCRLLIIMERSGRTLDELTSTFEQALSLGLLTIPGGPTSGIVDIFCARASFEGRIEASEQADSTTHPLLLTFTRGFATLESVDRAGDGSLRMEKFLLNWAESRASHLLDQSLLLVEKPTKARNSSYQMCLLRAGVETRRGNQDGARQIYFAAIQRSDLDWPEAVFEAYMQFENVHGSLSSLLQATQRIEKEQARLLKRRVAAAQEQQSQYVPPAEDISTETNVAIGIVESTNNTAQAPVASKREEVDSQVKRDREHTTLLVTGLAKHVDTGRVEAFFVDCGALRETTLLPGEDSVAALVEFREAEAVPAALAKNRKRLDGHEVAISMLWRSTLFVTNFPRQVDDGILRVLFAQYGLVLQTRWPSRKFADNRRFCYVTMASPASAQNALELQGRPMEGGFGLSVLISDPAAKVKRTDAVKSTLFTGGWTPDTTEHEVEQLFRPYGQVRQVKLGWDLVRQVCKGFAFVEMGSEDEAKATLTLSGSRRKGRVLKVEISDRNHSSKKAFDSNAAAGAKEAADRRARSIRINGIPDGTQEGLLQQEIEKIVPVKRLEIFARTHHAVAELEAQADAGLLLLRPEPFIFDGATLTLTEQGRRPPLAEPQSAVRTQPTTALLTPRAARKPKALGKGRHAPSTNETAATTVSYTSSDPSGQGVFRDLVVAKNKKREENLADKLRSGYDAHTGEKRPMDEPQEQESKRPKTYE